MALAVVIFAEKLWRHGRPSGQAVGLVLVAAGVLAIWFPWLLPGLHASAMPVVKATQMTCDGRPSSGAAQGLRCDHALER